MNLPDGVLHTDPHFWPEHERCAICETPTEELDERSHCEPCAYDLSEQERLEADDAARRAA